MSKSFKVDLTGQRFGRLTVLEFVPNEKPNAFWKCRCDCGNEKIIAECDMKRKQTISCGCYSRDKKIKHSGTGTRLYTIWKNMRQRCNNPKSPAYKYYGKRGICVDPAWNDFVAFRDWAMSHGYDDTLSIDRIDVNGNYTEENCRWIPMEYQAKNTRRNKYVEYQRKKMCIREASTTSNICAETLYSRLNRHEKDLFAPPKPKNIIVVYKGEEKTLADVARLLNIHHDTLYARYHRGDRGNRLFRPVEK